MCLTVGGGGTVIKPKSPLLKKNANLLPFFPQKSLPSSFSQQEKNWTSCLSVKYETYVSSLEFTLWQHVKDICTLLSLN